MTTIASQPIQPERAPAEEVRNWPRRAALRQRMVLALARVMPRGRGRMMIAAGHTICRGMRSVVPADDAGALMAVDPANLNVYLAPLLGEDPWVAPILRACRAVLSEMNRIGSSAGRSVFYDIGANAGFVSMGIATHFAGEVSVHAFEPLPALARMLALSAALNRIDHLHVYRTMLGRAPGEGELFTRGNSLEASSIHYDRFTPGATAVHAHIESLDRLVTSGGIPPPTLMKVDVEGAEPDVFAGALEMIKAYRPAIIFESFARNQNEIEVRRALVESLGSAGNYRSVFVGPHHFEPIDRMEDDRFGDILMLPAHVSLPTSF